MILRRLYPFGAALTLVIGVVLFHARNSSPVENLSSPQQMEEIGLHKTNSSGDLPRSHTKSADDEEVMALPSKKTLRDLPQTEAPPLAPSLPFIRSEDLPTALVDSFAPGNRLPVNKHTVEVQGYKSTPQGNALVVVITPEPAVEQAPPETTPEATTDRVSAATLHSPSRSGFTPEEELFRTKWGWAAFAQVQREAALHPDDTP